MLEMNKFLAGAAALGILFAGISVATPASAAEDAPKMGSVIATEKSRSASAFMDAAGLAQQGGAPDFASLAPKEARPSEFDPEANPRVYEISTQLRCLVCANETIAESNAQLAIDLRREVAEQVKAGKTDDEIIGFIVDRYGDYVLFKPPFKAKTYLLWLGPAVFFLLALWGMLRVAANRRAQSAARRKEATPEALEEAKRLLRGELLWQSGKIVPNPRYRAPAAQTADAGETK